MAQGMKKQIKQLNRQAGQLYQRGRYEQALGAATNACDLARRHLGEQHPDYALSLNNLASIYRATGDYAAAEPLYRQALEIRRKILEETHPHVAASLSNLGLLYLEMGDHAAAEPLLRQALQIRRKVLGEGHPDVALSLNNLGGLYYEMGDYGTAEPLYREALEIRRVVLGPEHPDVAQTVGNLAELHRTTGDYAAAEPLYRQALQIQRKALGERHPHVAQSLSNLGLLYVEMGDYAAAEPLYHQALDIWRKTLGQRHPRIATGLLNLGGLYYEMGDHAAAVPLYNEALEIQRAALGPEHPAVATSLNNLGRVHHRMGDYAAARPLYDKALAIERKALGTDHPALAQTLDNLGSLREDTGDYAAAEARYDEALLIRRKALTPDHPAIAESLDKLGHLHHTKGEYREAEPLYNEALAIRRKALGPDHPHVATSLNNLAVLYGAIGDYAAAEKAQNEALDIRREALGKDHPQVAHSLHNLGGLYHERGDYAAAEPLYRQALEIRRRALGPDHRDVALTLSGLGELHHVMRDYAAAIPLYHQALETSRKALGPEHPQVALNLHNLAGVYSEAGDYAAAEKAQNEALDIWREALGQDHPHVAQALNNLAVLRVRMGKHGAAERLHRQTLEIRREALGEYHPDVAQSLNNLALLYGATARTEEAFSLMEHAARIDDRLIGQVFSIGSESQRMAYLRSLEANFAGFLSLITRHFSQDPAAVRTALDLVLRREAIGAEALAAQRDAVLGGRYPELAPQLEELSALRMQIAQKTLAGPGKEGLEAHQKLLAEWNEAKEDLEAELARQIPEMSLEERLRGADRRAVAGALPEGAALVEFVRVNIFDFKAVPAQGEARWKPARYLAFVLPASEPEDVHLIDLGEAEPIDRRIAAFRASITGQDDRGSRDLGAVAGEAAGAAESREGLGLREALFDPLLPALGDREQLFLAPDGDLTRLPFEVLPTGASDRLIDRYHISYVGTGRDVLGFDAHAAVEPAEPLVAADPDFNLGGGGAPAERTSPGCHSRDLDRSEVHFGRLPGTHVEGQRIADMLGVEPWLEEGVLEARLKAMHSPRILHLATHGFFLADQEQDPNQEFRDLGAVQAEGELGRLSGTGLENPLLRSGLALAGANTWLEKGNLPPEAEDGILTAEDVSGLDMLVTELAVLSACETGLGEVHVGEGVFGLRRAFVLAGARTLVMSLWNVPDEQTQELMEAFYRRLIDGQPRADALREAQLSARAKHPQPLYWGAFICQGDPSPLPWVRTATSPTEVARVAPSMVEEPAPEKPAAAVQAPVQAEKPAVTSPQLRPEPVPEETSAPPPLPLSFAAEQLIQSALRQHDGGESGEIDMNQWLATLLDEHRGLAEDAAEGRDLDALQSAVRRVVEQGAARQGLTADVLVDRASERARAAGQQIARPQDMAAAILTAALRTTSESAEDNVSAEARGDVPRLPLSFGAEQMIQAALRFHDAPETRELSANQWLAALLAKHRELVEDIAGTHGLKELEARARRQLDRGEIGAPLARGTLIARASQRAEQMSRQVVTPRDLATVILTADPDTSRLMHRG